MARKGLLFTAWGGEERVIIYSMGWQGKGYYLQHGVARKGLLFTAWGGEERVTIYSMGWQGKGYYLQHGVAKKGLLFCESNITVYGKLQM